MMHALSASQPAAKHLFHDQTMLHNVARQRGIWMLGGVYVDVASIGVGPTAAPTRMGGSTPDSHGLFHQALMTQARQLVWTLLDARDRDHGDAATSKACALDAQARVPMPAIGLLPRE